MKKYVAGFVFSEDKKLVALIQKNRPTWQAGKYNAIGGHIEDGEQPVQAMAREFTEEANIAIPSIKWDNFAVLYNHTRNGKVFFFRAFHPLENVKTMTDEFITIFNVNNLPENKINNLNWLIPMALDLDLEIPVQIMDSGVN